MCLQWSKCFRFTLNKSTIFALYLKRVWLPLHIFCVSTIRSLQNAALLQWFLFSVRCSLFPYGTKWFFLLFNRKPHYRLCRTKYGNEMNDTASWNFENCLHQGKFISMLMYETKSERSTKNVWCGAQYVYSLFRYLCQWCKCEKTDVCAHSTTKTEINSE